MPNITSRAAIYEINSYFLSLPRFAELVNYEEGVSEYTPFWPAQEEIESVEPFIRYQVSTIAGADDYWTTRDFVSYFIYAKDLTVIQELSNIILHEVRTGYGFALRINQWMADNDKDDFRFKTANFRSAETADPVFEEGGIRPSLVSFSTYYHFKEGLGQL